MPSVLSFHQARALLAARQSGQNQVELSFDLELSRAPVQLESGRAVWEGGELPWEVVQAIAADEKHCFALEDGAARVIQAYSERLGRHYSLYPTAGAPTLLIAGFPMHRIKNTDPWTDTLSKVRALGPARGRVLDTSLGLGYTAIALARQGARVFTLELDPVTLSIARQNPWSRELFTRPNLSPIVADSYDLLPALPDRSFDAILHDPPTFSLAGELYSGAFYRELFRVLRPRGRLFHYIGDLDSRSGSQTARGAARRLQESGFTRITPRPEAFGLTATK